MHTHIHFVAKLQLGGIPKHQDCDGIYNQDAEKNKRFNQPCKDTKNAKKKLVKSHLSALILRTLPGFSGLGLPDFVVPLGFLAAPFDLHLT